MVGWRRFSLIIQLLVYVAVIKLMGGSWDVNSAATVTATLTGYFGTDLTAKLAGAEVSDWQRFAVVALVITLVFVLQLKDVPLTVVTSGLVLAPVGVYLGVDLKAKFNGILK